MPDNYDIADQFSLLAKLMDIHGENSFKSKTYSIAAYNIERLPVALETADRSQIFSYKGIGDSIGKKIIEVLETGSLPQLQQMIEKTPPGVLDLLSIKGLGPKKISTIWKEMEIESVGELLYACNENRLTLYKGFGEKTQKNVQDAIEFKMKNLGSHLYAEVETYARQLIEKFSLAFPENRFELTGEFLRQLEVINKLEFVTTVPRTTLVEYLTAENFTVSADLPEILTAQSAEGIQLHFHLVSMEEFEDKLFFSGSSESFLQKYLKLKTAGSHLPEHLKIPAYLRESAEAFERNHNGNVIQVADIKGIIHCHSDWSDGSNTLPELAEECIRRGLEYLVISDHSKAAFYAKGLSEERILAQHAFVDELNLRYAPFKIFKSIECDILNDGTLDYRDEVLTSFDLVITSVHSNLKMTEEKAMKRLLAAIGNPYTTILGHMTGRLLLSRNGYPVDHKQIIDACAEHSVAIELNAHPRRLDMDWRWISYAMQKNVMISIDPDAHYISGFNDLRYGVLAAQKGALTKEMNLSSLSRESFSEYIEMRKRAKNIR